MATDSFFHIEVNRKYSRTEESNFQIAICKIRHNRHSYLSKYFEGDSENVMSCFKYIILETAEHLERGRYFSANKEKLAASWLAWMTNLKLLFVW